MKRMIFVFTGILLVIVSCGGFKRTERRPHLTITPQRLELFVNQHTDPYTIKVGYTLNVPQYYISSCARLVYKPYFTGNGQRYDLTPLIITGKEYMRQENRLEALTGKQPGYPDAMYLVADGGAMQVKMSQVVPFELWMPEAELKADVSLEACDKNTELYSMTLARGMVYIPLGPGPALVKYVKEISEVQKTSVFNFVYPLGQDELEIGYDGNKNRMQDMMKLMDSLQNNSRFHLEKIIITGSCSPVGTLAYNKLLAQKRAEQMKQHFIQKCHIDAGLIELQTITEDWEGVRRWAEQSDITDKTAVIGILDGNYNDTQREGMLRKLPQYDYIRLNVYPDLQKVNCDFRYTRREEVTKAVPL